MSTPSSPHDIGPGPDTTRYPARIFWRLARITDCFQPYAWPLVRIVAGAFLVPHGAQKLFGAFGGGGLEGTAQGMARMGFEPGWLMALLAGGTEFFGGILVAIGLLTRPAAAVCAFLLVVASSVHLPNGFFVTERGWEYAVMWLALMIAITWRGAGRLSVDRAIGKEF